MGYMGLKAWGESDRAADLVIDIFDAIVCKLEKGLKDPGNEYNTCGVVNVALFNEEFLYPIRDKVAKVHCGGLASLLEKVAQKLEELIEKSQSETWEDCGNKTGAENKKQHLAAYRRLLKKLNNTASSLRFE